MCTSNINSQNEQSQMHFVVNRKNRMGSKQTIIKSTNVLLMQRNRASTMSDEIVYNAAQMFDGLHLKKSASGE